MPVVAAEGVGSAVVVVIVGYGGACANVGASFAQDCRRLAGFAAPVVAHFLEQGGLGLVQVGSMQVGYAHTRRGNVYDEQSEVGRVSNAVSYEL